MGKIRLTKKGKILFKSLLIGVIAYIFFSTITESPELGFIGGILIAAFSGAYMSS